jgi:hypothetical protein
MSDERDSATIKVVDRRRFYDDKESSESAIAEGSNESSSAVEEELEIENEGNENSFIDDGFVSFILSLAQQASWQLGLEVAPAEMQVPKDLKAARQMIDIIGMLENRTKGNLLPREAELLKGILNDLRLAYVKVRG